MKYLFAFVVTISVFVSCNGDRVALAFESLAKNMIEDQDRIKGEIQKEFESLNKIDGIESLKAASNSFNALIESIRRDIVAESGGYIKKENGSVVMKDPNSELAVTTVLKTNGRFNEILNEIEAYDKTLSSFIEKSDIKESQLLGPTVFGSQSNEQMKKTILSTKAQSCLMLLLSFQHIELASHLELLRSLK